MATKSRGILVAQPLIKPIRMGRKTCTRRLVGCPEGEGWHPAGPKVFAHEDIADPWFEWRQGRGYGDQPYKRSRCPYGKIGDLLYVRETWAPADQSVYGQEKDSVPPQSVIFKSDNKAYICNVGQQPYPAYPSPDYVPSDGRWRPSIHMPKWAARTWLEITQVKIQRLQEITEEEAINEGITMPPGSTAVQAFAELWDELASQDSDSWAMNPWVWAIDFKLVGKSDA